MLDRLFASWDFGLGWLKVLAWVRVSLCVGKFVSPTVCVFVLTCGRPFVAAPKATTIFPPDQVQLYHKACLLSSRRNTGVQQYSCISLRIVRIRVIGPNTSFQPGN